MAILYLRLFVQIYLLIVTFSREFERCEVNIDLSACYTKDTYNYTQRPCSSERVCRKRFNITHLNQKPFSILLVADMISTCCGSCSQSAVVKNVSKVSEIPPRAMSESDFVFPVLGRGDEMKLYGYWFIPFLETPIVYYITHKPHNMLEDLISSCLSMWPLIVICLLLVIISGFLCWIMETWGNEKEFPRAFARGWFEGIWWSFISMTTVGYGDKAPKSVFARIFSVAWIVVGITTFSLVTATLTSEIISANARPPPTMRDSNVGASRHHLYESFVIADKGGILYDIDHANITDGIHNMIHLLDNQVIDGFVLDRYEMFIFFHHFIENPQYQHDVQFLQEETILNEVATKEKFYYGILVKNEEDYEYLVDFMKSNRDVINSCSSLFLSNETRNLQGYTNKDRPSLFSSKGQLFLPTFIFCSAIIGLIFIFGFTFEFRKRKNSDIRVKWNKSLLK